MNQELIHSGYNFQVVDFIPYGYKIWNIGRHMKEDYLPLVQVGGDDGCQVVGIMKALPLKNAQKILSVIGAGHNTPKKMQAFIDKHKGKGIDEERVQRMEEALEIMLKIKGVHNL